MRDYDQHQIDNWKNSKSIEVYRGNPQQILQFVDNSLKQKHFRKKLYFGKVGEDLTEAIRESTGVETEDMNLALYSDEIIKIFADHGSQQKETQRGQHAVSAQDFVTLLDVVQNPDNIQLSETDRFGKPVLAFSRNIDGRRTVVTYTSTKHNDLRAQTMYIGNKKEAFPRRWMNMPPSIRPKRATVQLPTIVYPNPARVTTPLTKISPSARKPRMT